MMSIVSLASGSSAWRGYEYFIEKKVISHRQLSDVEYEGIVRGTKDYHVKIDVEHPRKSACNCPHAHGKRIMCKHMVALFFTIFPREATLFSKRVEEYEIEENDRWENHLEEIRQEVYRLSKEELRHRLIESLIALEEVGHYDRF